MLLVDAIKTEAYRLGFTLVGVTSPDQPSSYPIFESWLEQGLHGDMAYLSNERSRQRRKDPLLILPECRSILVLAMPYSGPQPATHDLEYTERGKVAAYALGDDYHEVLPDLLRQLVNFIQVQVGVPFSSRCYTDVGPLLERDLAQRAGLGWIGKNTCLINPRQGSYFLLAEILLEIKLEADQPFIDDRCGSCTRCLDACPTACILPNRTLDARRCISYLTIELKDSIPGNLRPLVGSWVFGCDICQQVCPWNVRFSSTSGHPSLQARSGIAEPDLVSEMALTPQAFNLKFKRSPVKRAKRRGYLRNVAVALGNSCSNQAVQALAQALQVDPEPIVRQHAAWALGQIKGAQPKRILEQALSEERDPGVQLEIRRAFVQALSE